MITRNKFNKNVQGLQEENYKTLLMDVNEKTHRETYQVFG